MKKTRIATTKIGDVFSAKINENTKKYFQLVGFDLSQLNSDVIRAFKEPFEIGDDPALDEIVKGEVLFYAHCNTRLGLKMGFWERAGSVEEIGRLDHILFRDTSDYGSALGEEPIRISNNWYVWRIGRPFRDVGRLEGENRESDVGIVINPLGIIELLKGNKYPPKYPDFE